MNPTRPSRNAATASSLAAFSSAAAVPPRSHRSPAPASGRGNGASSGAAKSSLASLNYIKFSHPGANALGPAQAVGNRGAHIRVAQLGQYRTVNVLTPWNG